MQTTRLVGLVVAVAVGLSWGLLAAAQDDKPKYTIKEVMQKAHKSGLVKKVASGQGSKEEAAQLVEMYTALGKNKPPKGDAGSWDQKTKALLAAAQAVVDGKPGAGMELQNAANCMACHSVHKGK
jgi:hypothetical protein